MHRRAWVEVCAVVICLFGVWTVPGLAEECSFNSPPLTLGALFSTCETAAGYQDYRIAEMVEDTDFTIDQMEAFQITHDFSYDREDTDDDADDDAAENKIEGQIVRTMCTGRVKFKVLAYVNDTGEVEEGYQFGYYATEMPTAFEQDPTSCANFEDLSDALALLNAEPGPTNRPGLLFLPGYQNYATPGEAARIAASLSSELIDSDFGKVFALVIAPPGHIAANLTQGTGSECLFDEAGEDFCTITRGISNGGFGQLSFGAYGRDAGEETYLSLIGWWIRKNVVGWNQGKYLTDGFLNPADVRPMRNLIFVYSLSAMRAINLFDKFFADQGLTNGKLYLHSFSLGGLVSLIANEADRDDEGGSTRISGISTFAAHASLKDNFRVPGNNMGRTIMTSGRALGNSEKPIAPLVSWDCDRDWFYTSGVFPQGIEDRMAAGCRLSEYLSPLSYEPTYDMNRPILLTQGNSDEAWSVHGLETTYEYLSDYQGQDVVRMNLEGDVDHKYFLAGVPGNYFFTTLFPSDAIPEEDYPGFTDTVGADINYRNTFETFINADWLNPNHSDFVDSDFHPSDALGWNRLQTTTRSFILGNAGYENVNDPVLVPPPAPVRRSNLNIGLDIVQSVSKPNPDTVVRYDMTACYDESLESSYADLEIVFRATADRLWHVLPACENEATTSAGTYTVEIDSEAYDYNSACYKLSESKFMDKCVDSPSALDTSTAHDGFVGVAPQETDPEGYVCRTFAVEFKGPTNQYKNGWMEPNQFTAWAELRAYDGNGVYQGGSTGPLATIWPSSLPFHTNSYTQCVRPAKDEDTYRDFILSSKDPFDFLPAMVFDKTPSCNATPVVLDEWPKPVDDETVLDFTGYNVVVPAATGLETADHGLTIKTDCDFSIASSSALSVDEGVNDATLSIVARNITVNGQIWNQTDESAAIRLIALDTITVGGLGEVSIRNNNRDGEDESGLIELSAQGDVEILGEINAQQKYYGGSVLVSGEDVTFGTDSRTVANAQSGATSYAGSITVWANDDLMVEWDSDPYQRAIFTAQGDSEDGEIDFTGCTIDPEDGDFDPSATHHPYECPLTDILDIESVDWCDNYEDNDLCCQIGDPCGYGYDGVCQCADSCEWDVMDCTGAPVGVQVSNIDDPETPVIGAECVIVDNVTGVAVDPEVSTTSDANGFCWFGSIENFQTYSVRVTHDDFLPTYLFNLPAPALPMALMLPTALVDDIEEYFEIEVDPEDGIVLGFVLWGAPSGFHEPVGCAEVTNDSGQNAVFYSDEYGPNPERTATSPANSGFLVFNVPTGGPYEFTATVDEVEETSTNAPQVFASAVTINYLVYGGEYETNPTPAECE